MNIILDLRAIQALLATEAHCRRQSWNIPYSPPVRKITITHPSQLQCVSLWFMIPIIWKSELIMWLFQDVNARNISDKLKPILWLFVFYLYCGITSQLCYFKRIKELRIKNWSWGSESNDRGSRAEDEENLLEEER